MGGERREGSGGKVEVGVERNECRGGGEEKEVGEEGGERRAGVDLY